MARITLHINGSARAVDVDPSTPLRYVLRNEFGLTDAIRAAALV